MVPQGSTNFVDSTRVVHQVMGSALPSGAAMWLAVARPCLEPMAAELVATKAKQDTAAPMASCADLMGGVFFTSFFSLKDCHEGKK